MTPACNCIEILKARHADLLRQADKAETDRRTRDHGRVLRMQAAGMGAATAALRDHQEEHTTMTDTLTTITPEIERDRYGRPMVVPPGGGKKVPYRRCTTFVGVLEDTWNLSRWSQRNVALGLADRPDLLLSVAAHRDDKDKLNQLCADATEAAHAAATTGTALHALTEIVDRHLDMPVLPESAKKDIDAYQAATACLEMVEIEQFGVLDDLKVGGTWDRLVRHDGDLFIADVKTGSLDFGVAKIAMQLAVYAHATPYDHVTGARRGDRFNHAGPVNQDSGLIIHLPAGQAHCELLWVDLVAGWAGVQIAQQVWDWRARKGLTTPFTTGFPDVFGLISMAADADAVRAVWAANEAIWTDAHTDAAKNRIDSLAATAA